MKREAAIHSKTGRLARALGIEHWGAIGILESLWHLTAREAPAGDIGKLTNEDIAYGVWWKGDPDKLVDALISCSWIDTSDEHRLLIHDWAEHADDGVHQRLAKSLRFFADGSAPKLTKISKKERGNLEAEYERLKALKNSLIPFGEKKSSYLAKPSQALPNQSTPASEMQPIPVSVVGNVLEMRKPAASETALMHGSIAVNGGTLTVSGQSGSPPTSSFSAAASRDVWVEYRWLRHPKKKNINEAYAALYWVHDQGPEVREAFDRHHEAMCKSHEWRKERGRYCPQLQEYVKDQQFLGLLDEDEPRQEDEYSFEVPEL